MPAEDRRDRYVVVAIALLALLALLYGVFVAQAALVWTGVAIPLVALYLFWRLVRAHERIADALE